MTALSAGVLEHGQVLVDESQMVPQRLQLHRWDSAVATRSYSWASGTMRREMSTPYGLRLSATALASSRLRTRASRCRRVCPSTVRERVDESADVCADKASRRWPG